MKHPPTFVFGVDEVFIHGNVSERTYFYLANFDAGSARHLPRKEPHQKKFSDLEGMGRSLAKDIFFGGNYEILDCPENTIRIRDLAQRSRIEYTRAMTFDEKSKVIEAASGHLSGKEWTGNSTYANFDEADKILID